MLTHGRTPEIKEPLPAKSILKSLEAAKERKKKGKSTSIGATAPRFLRTYTRKRKGMSLKEPWEKVNDNRFLGLHVQTMLG